MDLGMKPNAPQEASTGRARRLSRVGFSDVPTHGQDAAPPVDHHGAEPEVIPCAPVGDL